MRLYSNRKHTFPLISRLTAFSTLVAMIYGIFLPGPEILAQTFKSFDQESRSKLETYLDRAERLEDEEAWSNYVELGIATERAQWESEAYEELQSAYRQIDSSGADEETREQEKEEAEARFNAARMTWQDEAEALFQDERGRFEARKQVIEVTEVADEAYENLILAAESAMAAIPDIDLAGWDLAIQPGHQAIIDAFELELAGQITAARNNFGDLTGAELAAFDDEITRIENDIRAEFQTRDNFYVGRARNRYIALKRADELSARLTMEQTSADAVFDAIVGKTLSELDSETDSVLQSAIDEAQVELDAAGGDITAVGPDWNAKVEALIQSGLRKWEIAEEDLFSRRLAWEQEAKTTKEEANKIWKANQEALEQSMNNWLEKVEEQALEGRKQWEAKITELQRERQKSEEELAEYIQTQRDQWLASSEQLSELVEGGGSALLEAKDAYRYYGDQIELRRGEDPNCTSPVCKFYQDEQVRLGATISSFQSILANTEDVVEAQMHSSEGHTGLLNDRRLYAGDLPQQVAGIADADYRNDLTSLMQSQSEDFLLYRRDMLNLIDRNEVFVGRANELQASPDFDYAGAASLDAIEDLVSGLDQKYERHGLEISKILNEDREGTDAEKLTAIKTEIGDWFTIAVDENVRLKERTVAYFNDGLGGYLLSDQSTGAGDPVDGKGGYYTTGEQNDPYLMTQAEYEWELLRRERNYLAKKLRRAEEVKHYADLAFQHEAGLELAAITTERAEIAKAHADLKEIIHDLIAGTLDIVKDNTLTDAQKRDSLLADRGIDYAALTARSAQIDDERTLLDASAALAVGPDAATTLAMIGDIDAYLDARGLTGDARADHPLGALRAKLTAYHDAVVAGDPPAALADRWNILRSGAEISSTEMLALKDSYDFPGIDADYQRILDLIPAKNINEHQGDIADIKEQIEANAALLKTATDRLKEAKEEYHQAFVDYQVLVVGQNSEELIRVEISQATDQLASVLNRMVKVEESSGLCDSGGVLGSCVQDSINKETVEYLYEISEGEKAAEDYLQASTMLGAMQGLEAAKARLASLENVISANNFTGLTPEQIADIWIAEEANLVDRDSSEEGWRSSPSVRQAMDILIAERNSIPALQTALADANAEVPPDPAKIQLATRDISDAQEEVLRAVELLIASTRGEVRQRRDIAQFTLEYVDGGGAPLVKLEDMNDRHEAEAEVLDDLTYELVENAAARLDAFLNANRDQDFATILQTLNDTIAALPPRTPDTTLTGYGSAGAALPGARAEWKLVRDWIVARRASIDYANKAADMHDPRTPAARWDDLIEQTADLDADAAFHRNFESNIPADATDPRMVAFRTEREGVLARLALVLAQPDAALAGAYQSMTAADREILESYGATDQLNLRVSLQGMEAGIERDLYRLDRDYRAIYLREESRLNAALLRTLQPDLLDQGGQLESDRLEKATLELDRANLLVERASAPPADIPGIDLQIAEIDARLPVLDARIIALEPVVANLEDQIRQASNVLREARDPGSTSPLFHGARDELYGYNRGANILRSAVDTLKNIEYTKDLAEEDSPPPTAQIKGILGIYRTDADGKVMLDQNGVGIPDPGFQAWSGLDPHADLTTLMGGENNGTQLETWTTLLQEWVEDPTLSGEAPREVVSAIGLLEESMREMLAAREFIEATRQGLSAQDILGQAETDAVRAQERMTKLTLVLDMHRQLKEAVEMAQQGGADPINAALAVLEKPENAKLLFEFEDTDPQGQPNMAADANIRQRLDEMRRVAERLRDARVEGAITRAAAHYGQFQLSNLGYVNDPTIAVWPSAEEFFKAYPELDGASVQADVDQLALEYPHSFREKLFEYVADLPEDKSIHGGEIASLLSRDRNDGLALKNALDATLLALRTRIDDSLAAHAVSVDRAVTHERDLDVTTSVAALLDAYSNRGDTARTAFLPELDAIAPTMGAEEARDQLRDRVDVLLEDAIFTTVREDVHRVLNEDFETYETRMDEIDASGDTESQKAQDRETARIAFILAVKSRIAAALYAVPTLTSEERTDLGKELYVRELRKAVSVSDLAENYDPEAYPEELRQFVLIRQYTRAEERYTQYLDLRNADTQAERDRATFNLSGLNGDFARNVLARDFNDYLAANPITAFLAGGEGRKTIDDYLAGYFHDRKTGPQNLPGGGALLTEIVALSEYRRIQADAAGPGLITLDERNYFRDMAPYLLAAKMKDFATRNALALPAGTEEDRKNYLRPHFESLLNDATYSVAGQSLGARNPAEDRREALFALFFADMSEGPSLEQYIPAALDDRRLNGKLDEDPPPADEYYPDELLAIPGYAAADYRALAAAVGDETRDALARLETQERAATEDLSLLLSDPELEEIVVRAGHGGLPAEVRAELVEMVRAMNERARLGQGGDSFELYQAFRQRTVLDTMYPDRETRRALKTFMEAQIDVIQEVEDKFFGELSFRGEPLREQAKMYRGRFLRALIEHHRALTAGGADTAYYNSLSPDLKADMDFLYDRLFVNGPSAIESEDIDVLLDHADRFEEVFDLRSGQELVSSGILEDAQTALFNSLHRSASDTLLEEARANTLGVTRDFIDLIFHAEGGGDPNTFVPQTGIVGLKQELLTALDTTSPRLLDLVGDEEFMLQRMLDNYLEDQADRQRMDALLYDGSLAQPDTVYVASFETDRSAALATARERELAGSLLATLGDHGRYYEEYNRRLAREQYLAGELKKFAKDRGKDDANFTESRFANYRSFIGAERAEQLETYRKYVDQVFFESEQNDNTGNIDMPDSPRTAELRAYLTLVDSSADIASWTPPSGVKGFYDYFGGKALEVESMNVADPEGLLMAADWQDNLTSDNPNSTAPGAVHLPGDPNDPSDDVVGSVRRMKTVMSYDAMAVGTPVMTADGPQVQYGDTIMRRTYFANLANNYLEKVTNLNAALNNVFRSAKMADARRSTETSADYLSRMRAAYDATATGPTSVDDLRNMQIDAQTRQADHDQAKISEAYADISGQKKLYDKAADNFAQASRRRLMANQRLLGFIETVMKDVSKELDAARTEVSTLETTASDLRVDYGNATRDYTNALNAMSDAYREFTRENEEYEMRQAVREYAETPYLFNLNEQDEEKEMLEKQRGDADKEFELALAAYEDAQKRLKDAGYSVMIQDDLGRLDRLATVLADPAQTALAAAIRTPLTDAERDTLHELRERRFRDFETLTAAEVTQLEDLTDREMYERYDELLLTRQDHIAHTMRMVRLQKVSEIINPEIERRRARVEQKRKEFEDSLNEHFGVRTENETNEEALEARNAVYQRLSAVVAGGGDLYNEYRSWYWGRNQYLEDMHSGYAESVLWGQPVVPEVWPSQINEGIVGILIAGQMPGADRHMLNKWMDYGGTFAEFGNWSGVYYSFMQSLGVHDIAKMERDVIVPIQTVIAVMGQAMMSTVVLYPVGHSMYRGAMKQIAQAQLKYLIGQVYAVIMQVLAHQSAQDTTSIREVDAKREEYQSALAELEYFTKVPDIDTLKTRVVAFGAARDDDPYLGAPGNNLYNVTTDDLKYLVETDGAGDPIYPPGLTAEEQAEVLDVSVKRRTVQYHDVFGNRYDPDDRVDSAGFLDGGLYRYTDGKSRIRRRKLDDAGRIVGNEYGVFIEDDDPREHTAYDMGQVLDLTVAHGRQLREDRREKYLAAGAALEDRNFALHERDSVASDLFQRAADRTEGGREFSGYRMAFTDLQQNADDVFAQELAQRKSVQTLEWDLREQELNDAYKAWDDKIKTIMKRGREAWSGALDRYAQRWRQWERDYDQEVADGKVEWEQRVQEHFTEKSDWETQMRTEMQQVTVQNTLTNFVDNLNASISGLNNYSGATFKQLDRIAVVNTVLDELKQGEPGRLERLKGINKNIKDFNTNLSLSELSNGNFLSGNASVNAQFAQGMADYKQRMTIVANVKAYEQYRLMLNGLKEQIRKRNDAVEKQTEAAAFASGYVRVGGQFVKFGASKTAISIVDQYQRFDGDKAIEDELALVGLDGDTLNTGNVTTKELLSEGHALVGFLGKQSDVEIASFFSVQQLAIQTVTGKIMGRGRASERNVSQDPQVLGTLGMWIGRPPNSVAGQIASMFGAEWNQDTFAPEHVDMFARYGPPGGGFGELGRFYSLIQFGAQHVEMENAKAIENAGGTLNPLDTFIQQINPISMMANSYQNVELYAKRKEHRLDRALESGVEDFKQGFEGAFNDFNNFFNPKPKGFLGSGFTAKQWLTDPTTHLRYMKQQGAGPLMEPLGIPKYLGSKGIPVGGGQLFLDKDRAYMWEAQYLAMTKSILGVIPIIGQPIARGIKVDTRTGERSYKYTDQDKDDLKASLFGIYGEYWKSGREYDEDGNYTHTRPTGGREGTADLIRSTIGKLPIVGQTLGEYTVRQTVGRDLSHYDQMYKPDMGSMGNVVSLILTILAAVEGGGGSEGSALDADPGSVDPDTAVVQQPTTAGSIASEMLRNLINQNGADALRGFGNLLMQHGRDNLAGLRDPLGLRSLFSDTRTDAQKREDAEHAWYTPKGAWNRVSRGLFNLWDGQVKKHMGALANLPIAGLAGEIGWIFKRMFNGREATQERLNDQRTQYQADRKPGAIRDIMSTILWANDSGKFTSAEVRGQLEYYYQNGATVQDKLLALGTMRDSGLYDQQELEQKKAALLSAYNAEPLVSSQNGMEGFVFKGTPGKPRSGDNIVYVHGLRSDGTGKLGAVGIVGDYYNQLDIQKMTDQGYNVIFVNGPGRGSNEESSATVALQLAEFREKFEGKIGGGDYHIISHSRGGHDVLAMMTNATAHRDYEQELRDSGFSAADIERIRATNLAIAAQTKNVYLTSPALRGPMSGTIADNTLLTIGTYLKPNMAAGYPYNMRSDGQRSLTNSSSADLYKIYESGRHNFTADVTMIAGDSWGFSGGGTGGEKVETFVGGLIYALNPLNWFSIANKSFSFFGPGSDGAVGVDGQLNTEAISRLHSGQGSISAGRSGYIRDKYQLNHGGTRDDPTMMNDIFRHMNRVR